MQVTFVQDTLIQAADSLYHAADSLSSAVDSLGNTADSLLMSAPPAPVEPQIIIQDAREAFSGNILLP